MYGVDMDMTIIVGVVVTHVQLLLLLFLVFMFAIMMANATEPIAVSFYGVNLVFMPSEDAIFYMDKSHIVVASNRVTSEPQIIF